MATAAALLALVKRLAGRRVQRPLPLRALGAEEARFTVMHQAGDDGEGAVLTADGDGGALADVCSVKGDLLHSCALFLPDQQRHRAAVHGSRRGGGV